MKLSLALGPRQPLSRQTAWGCFTTNLAMPGFGSLLAGRRVGYAQIPFTMTGFALSLVGVVRTAAWLIKNWSSLQQLQMDDPGRYLLELWAHFRMPFLGIALFFFAMAWALITSRSIMAESRAAERANSRPVPPKL